MSIRSLSIAALGVGANFNVVGCVARQACENDTRLSHNLDGVAGVVIRLWPVLHDVAERDNGSGVLHEILVPRGVTAS